MQKRTKKLLRRCRAYLATTGQTPTAKSKQSFFGSFCSQKELLALLLFGLASPACAQTTGLLGNIGGLRTVLGNVGITLNINDSENLLGNVVGGIKQGATLQGVATADLQIDTSKALGIPGGTFNISALQIHGRGLSPYYLADIQAANGNEADDATRLWELWYDQVIGPVDIKLGQQSIDNEFIVSSNSGLFVNTMAGWPLIPSDDLYAGGPAYPLSSLGARIQLKPTSQFTILAGAFDDNPPGGAFADDPQSADAGGTRFNLNTGALFITELQFANAQAKFPGTYKLGFWIDTGSFPDQEIGSDGLSLANPASNGTPAMHHGNYSLYAVVDQTLFQAKSGQTLNVFGRLMGAPASQNFIALSFNGGLTLGAPFASRPNDLAGIDFGLAKVSSRTADLDRDSGNPVQSTEEIFELTYQAAATPWLNLQPDLQYIIRPGGGVIDPDTGSLLRNELVIGLRAVTVF